ncbi:MAG: hypothetical protein HKN31_06420 [Pricia sp.]|nr:hypothetical protein [Pricia sp.]
MNLFSHFIAPHRVWGFLCAVFLSTTILNAQRTNPSKPENAVQILEMDAPKKLPLGYESIVSFELSTPLESGKAYEVGFWIFGRQLQEQGYSYPIVLFPSYNTASIKRNVLKEVEANDSLPKLEVKPPPSFTAKGHFTFTVRPNQRYNTITIALEHTSRKKAPIDFQRDITVTGMFVRALLDRNEKRKLNAVNKLITTNPPRLLPETLAERKLMNSQKSDTLSERRVRIGLYDHRNIDKDIVTIYLNDKIVVAQLELNQKKQFFDITLRPGLNTITLHAENLGEVAPNTAAILIKGKTKEFFAVLESDLGQSQYFTLICNPE